VYAINDPLDVPRRAGGKKSWRTYASDEGEAPRLRHRYSITNETHSFPARP
jgi:hypothetical protein